MCYIIVYGSDYDFITVVRKGLITIMLVAGLIFTS